MNGERVDSGGKGPTRSWQGVWAGVRGAGRGPGQGCGELAEDLGRAGGGPFATLATRHVETLLDLICPQEGTAEGA